MNKYKVALNYYGEVFEKETMASNEKAALANAVATYARLVSVSVKVLMGYYKVRPTSYTVTPLGPQKVNTIKPSTRDSKHQSEVNLLKQRIAYLKRDPSNRDDVKDLESVLLELLNRAQG